jgi:hypothetical protein
VGLVGDLAKRLLEAGLEGELTDRERDERYDPVAFHRRDSRCSRARAVMGGDSGSST